MDRWFSWRAGSALRRAENPLVVDVGFGASAVTTQQWWRHLLRIRGDVRVVGLDIDAERVDSAAGSAIAGRLEFARGGFELAGHRPVLIRAANVLRQYDESDVAGAWKRMRAALQPGGFLLEGTCDEQGRIGAWILLDRDGPLSLTLAADVTRLDSPAVLAERLPKALIHRNVPNEPVGELMSALEQRWRIGAPNTVFGARYRWRCMLDAMAMDGWPIVEPPSRRRDGTVTVPWGVVAPSLRRCHGRRDCRAGRLAAVDAYLIDAVRTPFGRHAGGLSHIRTDDLAAMPIAELLRRNPELDPNAIDDVILGDTNGAGEDNRNVARMAALLADLPVTTPGVTVNRLCASGAEAIIQAGRQVACGDADTVIAGGVESMSRAPFVVPRPEKAFPRDMSMLSTQIGWRMPNPRFAQAWLRSLGESAQTVAAEYGITRAEQDEWALRSQQRAAEAWDQGLHNRRVMKVEDVPRDECVRPDTTLEKLGELRSAFTVDGAVTAGNASPISDGASAVVVSRTPGEDPLAQLVTSATVGVSPERYSIAPVDAIRKALARAGLEIADIAVWEINEAFAAMVLSCLHLLPDIDRARVNPHGGAIAYGHPLGASAPRALIDVCDQLRRRGGGYGVMAACIGVGQGVAMVVKVD